VISSVTLIKILEKFFVKTLAWKNVESRFELVNLIKSCLYGQIGTKLRIYPRKFQK